MVQFPSPLGKRYELLDHLGCGGMCDVYKGRQLDLDRLVAIKIPREEQCDKVQLTRLSREAKTCAKLRHPNIVAVYDVDEIDGLPFIAMELVEGKTFFDMLQDGVDTRKGLAIILDVAKALQYAHRKGIIHRDLKPGNVLIGKKGEVRVADWGLARAHEDVAGLTKTGLIMGTPQYISPEQVTDAKCNESADWYALGTMLFELCAKRLPFENEDLQKLIVDKIKYAAPSLGKVSGLSGTEASTAQELTALVDGLLERDVQKRPKGDEVIAALEGLIYPTLAKQPKIKSDSKKSSTAVLFVGLILVAIFVQLYRVQGEKNKISSHLESVTIQQRSLRELSLQCPLALKGRMKIVVQCEGETIANECFQDLSKEKTKGNQRQLRVNLSKPLLAPARVRLESGEVSFTQSLDGQKAVHQFFDKIACLSKNKDGWRMLVKELEEARTRLYQNKDKDNFDEILETCRLAIYGACDKAGFDNELRSTIREVMPNIFARQTIYPGSSLAKKLRPLRIIEALLSERRIFKLDWGYVSGLMGVDYYVKDYEAKDVLATIRTKELVEGKEKWLYMSDERYLSSFRQTKFLRNLKWAQLLVKESHIKNADMDTAKEVVPRLNEMRPHWRTSFNFDEPAKWPRRVRVELLLRRFVHYATINVSFNGHGPILITNTVVLSQQIGKSEGIGSAVWTIWVSMPFDPDVLRQGTNEIDLMVRDIWPLEATAVMAIGEIRIVGDD